MTVSGSSRMLSLVAGAAMLVIGYAWLTVFSGQNRHYEFDFPDSLDEIPANWNGPVFELSDDFPKSLYLNAQYPWTNINFKTRPEQYANTVLDYIIEGHIEADWVTQENKIRQWYHSPWMHWGGRGREFIRGMTRERSSRPFELASEQPSWFQSWGLALYNPAGGYALGKIWADPAQPNIDAVLFPVGTVMTKILFTNATLDQVPFLRDSLVWDANIFREDGSNQRSPQRVRLIQIDFAVRDSRADNTTGWVFGAFVYDADLPGDTPFERMAPVGLMWGNDPGVTPEMVQSGTELRESWINENVAVMHHGWGGRMNGPVDNPNSSCLSCHATAQVPMMSDFAFRADDPIDVKLRWFRNIKPDESFDPDTRPTDYSLQIPISINFFENSKRVSLSK